MAGKTKAELTTEVAALTQKLATAQRSGNRSGATVKVVDERGAVLVNAAVDQVGRGPAIRLQADPSGPVFLSVERGVGMAGTKPTRGEWSAAWLDLGRFIDQHTNAIETAAQDRARRVLGDDGPRERMANTRTNGKATRQALVDTLSSALLTTTVAPAAAFQREGGPV